MKRSKGDGYLVSFSPSAPKSMKNKHTTNGTEPQNLYTTAVAPQAVEVQEDQLIFPGAVMLPLSVRGHGLPGMPERPWNRLFPMDFFNGYPAFFSLSLQREAPDILKRNLRARRTLFEGFLLAMAEKTGRRPSMADQAADTALDATESALALGKPAFRASLLTALYASREREKEAELARRALEASLRAKGFIPQRLVYVAERALHHFQPGGELFPGLDEPVLLLEEATHLMPTPTRQVLPAPDAVWIGTHAREGRDVYFSFKQGFDPVGLPAPHAMSLILGEMGSGKTSLMRWIMLQRLLQGRTVISLDPEGENNHLCTALGGRVVPAGVPNDPQTCLLYPLQADDPAEMLLAARFLITALAGENALTPGAQAALHDAVKIFWEVNPGKMTIAELINSLESTRSPDAFTPIALLRPYAFGGLWDGFFDRPNALLSPNFPPGQWWNFDLSSLREENKAIVYAVLAWFLYHAVTVGKKPMDVFIDEGWRLLRSGMFADLLDELGRRARKRGSSVTLTTHLPGDLARGANSLSLASTAFVGRLGPEEAFAYFHSLGVPEGEAKRQAATVSRLPPRMFLAAPAGGRGSLFPVLVTIPPVWLAFWKGLGAAQ